LAHQATIPSEAEAAASGVAREEDRREWPGRGAPTLSDNSFLADQLKKDLNLDLARGQ
jgi:hypothetical protein